MNTMHPRSGMTRVIFGLVLLVVVVRRPATTPTGQVIELPRRKSG